MQALQQLASGPGLFGGQFHPVLYCVHSSFLELLERPSCFDALVLASVPDKNHAIIIMEPIQKFIYLPSARETRFVDNVEVRMCRIIGV